MTQTASRGFGTTPPDKGEPVKMELITLLPSSKEQERERYRESVNSINQTKNTGARLCESEKK